MLPYSKIVCSQSPVACCSWKGKLCLVHSIALFCFLLVWFEPTCLDKAGKVVDTGVIDMLTFISPNMAEFLEINRLLTASKSTAPPQPCKPTFGGHFWNGGCVHDLFLHLPVSQMQHKDWSSLLGPLLLRVPHIFLTLGSDGVFHACRESGRGRMYRATPTKLCPVNVVSTSGAGDR